MATDAAASRRRTATIHLPLVTAELHAPHLTRPHVPRPHVAVPRPPVPPLPGRQEMTDLSRGVAGLLPPKDQLALYGGLGAAAALGLLDWPVAVAVAAGTAVARHGTLRGSFADVARTMSGTVRATGPERDTGAAGPASRPTSKRSTAKRSTAKRSTAKRTTSERTAAKKTSARGSRSPASGPRAAKQTAAAT